MKRQRWMFLALAISFLMTCGPSFAHHGNAAYDSQHPITVKGIVTDFEWANPHVQIFFDVKDDNGKVTHWGVETLSPGKLVRCGWNKDAVKSGDSVTITTLPSKTGAPIGFLTKLVFANGKELSLKEED